jgi:two-component sensor histidine kinase
LAQEILAPYADGPGERVRLAGGPIKLAPRAATMLAMVLHELATNAAKYGALSCQGGVVAVSWRVLEGKRLRIDWDEAGGPRVREPHSRGFGTRLVERGIAEELKGSAQISFAPAGVRGQIEIPLPAGGR